MPQKKMKRKREKKNTEAEPGRPGKRGWGVKTVTNRNDEKENGERQG